jgi:hypothetical protein
VIALPANEYFDDECINDTDSALGAYIQKTFEHQVRDIEKLIIEKLQGTNVEKVEKEHNQFKDSYGVGTCIYLEKPLLTNKRIILVSVTTKRAGEGLLAEPSFIFSAIKSIRQVMVDNRLNELYIPLIGSGHGGIKKELALLYMLLAILSVLQDKSGHHIRQVNIVIFQKDKGSNPLIKKDSVKRMVSYAKSFYSS